MTGRMTARALVIGAGAWCVLAAAVHGQQQTPFRSGVDVVAVDVSVRDGSKPITNLTATDFEIRDNGVVQVATDASYGKLLVDLTIVLDTSLSVDGPTLQALLAAVGQTMQSLRTDDRVQLIALSGQVHQLQGFTSDAHAVSLALAQITPGGTTSILDALAVSLVGASEPARRHLILLFTDGVDTTSTLEEPTLLDLAERTNTAISLVVPIDPLATIRTPDFSNGFFGTLSDATGGSILVTKNGGDITSAFRKILDEFRTSYVLHFTPKGVENAGVHELAVRVTKSGHFDVRARKNYVGG